MKHFLPLLVFGACLSLVRAEDTVPAAPAEIRTPPAPETPRINGAHIFGARPGHPFFFHIPATGKRPMTFSIKGLPDGLKLDASTGNITGSVTARGDYKIRITATNPEGTAHSRLEIVIGDTVCLTPPMGWNSWNCFGPRIDERKIRAAADAMVAGGLIDHGWTYVNMDDKWEGLRTPDGQIQAGPGFPDIKGLAAYIHSLGLKVGLYSSPGPLTCGGAVGSFQHEDQDARTYGDWGMDYLKYDWCSYRDIFAARVAERYEALIPDPAAEIRKLIAWQHDLYAQIEAWPPYTQRQRDPEKRRQNYADRKAISDRLTAIYSRIAPEVRAKITLEEYQAPYRLMRAALDKVDRDIIFSFCQYGYGKVWEWGAQTGGNTWRTTDDIQANWKRIEEVGFSQNGLEKYAGPGHWNDPDMLEIGNGKLTPDENYTHMTLWCMLAAPLLIGCDMTQMSDFTRSLFTNDEVLAVNQDPLGKQGYRLKQDGLREVWVKPLADGTMAVALFNLGEAPGNVAVTWKELNLKGRQAVRDLWRQKNLPKQAGGLSVPVAAHGAELFRVGSPSLSAGE